MADSGLARNDAHRFAPASPAEEHVHGACCPSWHSACDHETAVEQWIEFVRGRGVERVCCLLAGRHLDGSGENVGMYRDAFGRDAVRHVPIPDRRLADVDTLRGDVLPFLDAAVADDAPVVVHCLAGLGRTGHVLAAWLVHARDYGPAGAVETVRETGRDPYRAVRRGGATRAELLRGLDRLA